MGTKKELRGLLFGGAVAAAVGLAVSVSWLERRAGGAENRQVPAPARGTAHYVGSGACASCHVGEATEWRTSHHRDAMADATEQTVLGNFNDATFRYAGITSTFFRREGRFRVRTDSRDGTLADFDVKYTFGIYPLQQYLVEFPDGRLQALSIAWDARPAKDGGQRWFHLYPTDRITHDDELHWTRPAQNWNFMCADCHSTGVRKNYEPAADRFKTSWADINVGCEACHGPGSRHLEWATERPGTKDDDKGLTASLDERRGVTWSIDVRSGNGARSRPRTTAREIDVCAHCHSRRGQIAEGYQAGAPLLDHYRPELLTDPLYYADGQQRGEVYNWGSFLQSKMHANGVTCSDCHDPHSGKVRLAGNALCATCHLASKYDTAEHHHHRPAGAGATCTGCHMPSTTYMVVDPRHDHSLRVPRPDLSIATGAPNACNGCHTNHDARWAAARVGAWYGHDPQGYQRFAAAFSARSLGTAEGQAQLRAIANDATEPPIARASALAQIDASSNGSAVLDTLARSLRDPSAIVRLGALQSLANAPESARVPLAAPYLSDPLKAIRIEAASLLEAVPDGALSPDARAAFERAANEYVEAQRFNADRAEARVNLGSFYASRGDATNGDNELRAAIRLDPYFIPAYVNLADLDRAVGRDGDASEILRQGLRVAPTNAMLHYALGLALVRLKQPGAALAELARANNLEAENPGFAFAYSVALHSAGRTAAARATLTRALAAHPEDADLLAARASFMKDDPPDIQR